MPTSIYRISPAGKVVRASSCTSSTPLEGFLSRLASSPYAGQPVLKGGVLLAAYNARRPTKDIDLRGQNLPNDVAGVRELVRSIAATRFDDGLTIDHCSARASLIRDDEDYHSVRVAFVATLATARLTFHVDTQRSAVSLDIAARSSRRSAQCSAISPHGPSLNGAAGFAGSGWRDDFRFSSQRCWRRSSPSRTRRCAARLPGRHGERVRVAGGGTARGERRKADGWNRHISLPGM